LRFLALLLVAALAGRASAAEPVTLRIVGGLGGVAQYEQLEAPFWRDRLPALTNGALRAEIAPFDRSGLRAQEMVRLIRLGVVPFGTFLAGVSAADDPVLGVLEMPLAYPSAAALRQVAERLRPELSAHLRERHGIELLAIYAYPAQVAWCRDAFTGLDDLRGRRVRVAAVGQLELFAALGAAPVLLPFAETTAAVRSGSVACAVTGTLSGYQIGLAQATRFVSSVPITWGVSFFAANARAWGALEPALQRAIRGGLAEVEAAVWNAADTETANGLACATGRGSCPAGAPANLSLVPGDFANERARRALTEALLPAWFDRCGDPCRTLWSEARVAMPEPARP
jgi:TRAP-type C4-dicarboxylate transport system substrate-binding protein